ncbi:hypothetical protein CRI69_20095 [Escherichia sp. E4742]|nr:hypothetical protein FEM44_13290 [Escherichia sp. E4742]TGB55269.1 hypothetical protein CRI69_20095 [Escherichia sp. E4742]TLJ07314.1 hypothetical protein FEK62_13290 [Escherichia sp. E4742]
MIKTASPSKKSHKQHSPEFHNEALKQGERIDVAVASRKLNLYESQFNNWLSKISKMLLNVNWRYSPRLTSQRQLTERDGELVIIFILNSMG